MFNDTVAFWRRWLGRSTYSGRWREQVLRSAMTLKLMTCAPSGALLAAQTTGYRSRRGGERNWDTAELDRAVAGTATSTARELHTHGALR